MVSSSKFTVPAIAAFTCIVAVGCGGDSYASLARLPNRPPKIVPNSLAWSPGYAVIRRGYEYNYSVRAIDPDIGDKVVKYWWRFGDGEETIETDGPSISHTFTAEAIGSVSVMASDNRGAIGPEVSFLVPLSSNNSPDIDVVSPTTSPASVVAGVPFVLSFKITDADNDDCIWTVTWGDGSTDAEGTASATAGDGALVTLSHTFAEDFVNQTLTVTIMANDQKMSNSQRTVSIALTIIEKTES